MSRDACDRTGAFARVGVVRAHSDDTVQQHPGLTTLGVTDADRHRAISAELVRLTLGGRGPERPELRTDMVGAMHRLGEPLRRFQADMAALAAAWRYGLPVMRPGRFTKITGA